MNMKPAAARRRPGAAAAIAWASICACLPDAATAADFQAGPLKATISGRVTLGTASRADAQDPLLVPAINGAAAGVAGVAASGINSDDANINFARGDTVSSVAKAFAALQLEGGGIGARLSAKAWHDFYLAEHGFAWGHSANGYVSGQPLDDSGFSSRSRFSGTALMDANVYGTFPIGGMTLHLRAGNQELPWGTRPAIAGGLRAYKPVDLTASQRPGAIADETFVPVPALFARLTVNEAVSLEGYVQARFRATEIPGCGTFFAAVDYVAPGCNLAFAGTPNGSDRLRYAAGAWYTKAPSPGTSNGGMAGFGGTWKAPRLDTVFGAYVARYTNPTASYDIVKSTRVAGDPQIAGNADGANTRYMMRNYEGVRMLALNFESRAGAWTGYGEFTYRPNQPVQMTSSDLTGAQTSNTAASLLRAQIAATTPGGILPGADRLKTTSLHLGATRQFSRMLGADGAAVGVEAAVKNVLDLPDVNVRRYGRPDVFGAGPVNGVCARNAPDVAKQCSNDGFVTGSAWGFRVAGNLRYSNVMPGLDLSPGVVYSQDVNGWSYDGVFSKGRQSLTLALAAVFEKHYSTQLSWSSYWGGRYSVAKDRDFVALSVAAAF